MKIFKKILCTLLVVVMCLTSAPLQGFVGMEWPSLPEIDFGEFELPEIDFSSWFGSKVNATDTLSPTGQCGDNVTWTLYEDGELVISGSGEMAGFDRGNCPWYSYNNNITSVVIKNGITSIGRCAFYDCKNLTNLSLSDTLTTIGSYAFYNCTNLENFEFGKGITHIYDYAFQNCDSITDITIPGNVTTIGTSAFYGCDGLVNIVIEKGITNLGSIFVYCTSLRNVSIPNSVTSINSTFTHCTQLEKIVIPDSVTTISNAFYSCIGLKEVTIGKNLTTIGTSTFSGCSGIQKIIIPDSVTTIGDSAFSACSALQNIVIPNSVTQIGNYAFYWCTGLKEVVIGDGVKNIGNYAFQNCTGISKLTIGDSVVNVGSYAFQNCTGMKEIIIPDSVATIGQYAFQCCTGAKDLKIGSGAVTIDSYAFSECTGLINIDLGNSVRNIGSYAFNNCDGIVNITIPNSVTAIEQYAFYGCDGLTTVNLGNGMSTLNHTFSSCTSLKNITLPESITNINGAFNNCISLKNITIPNNVTNINGAFSGCTQLEEIVIPDSVTTINSAFSGCKSLKRVSIGKNVTTIGDSAFQGCIGLQNVTIPENVTIIGQYAFYYCTGLSEIVIPDQVIDIGSHAFSNCSGLNKVIIGEEVKNIGVYAFQNCTGISNLIIGNNVTNIYNHAFIGCTGIKEIILPISLKSIGERAFKDCIGLSNVYYKGSEEQWKKIGISSDNSNLFNATIHFEYNSPTEDDNTSGFTGEISGVLTAWDGLSNSPKAYIDDIGYKVADNDDLYETLAANLFKEVVCEVKDGVIVSCKAENTEEDDGNVEVPMPEVVYESKYGKLESVVYFVVLDSDEAFISDITVDGKKYKVQSYLLDTSFDKYVGEEIVFRLANNEVDWISPVSELNSKISLYAIPPYTYINSTDGAWVDNVITFNIYNTLDDSLYNGNVVLDSLAKKPKYDINIDYVTLISTNPNVLTFNGQQTMDFSINEIFKLGEGKEFRTDIKLNPLAKESVAIKFVVHGSQNGVAFEKNAFSSTITVRNIASNIKPPNNVVVNDAEFNVSDNVQKANLELNKISGAASITNTTLAKIFTPAQITEIEKMLLCQVAMVNAPESTFAEYLSEKVIEKVFKIKSKYLAVYSDEVSVTVATNSKFGELKVKFTCKFTQNLLSGKGYGFTGSIQYEILDYCPESLVREGFCGQIAAVDMSAFCEAAYEVAEDELKENYKNVWGKKADKAADIIFGKSVNEILKNTDVESVSGLVWLLITTPAKEVKIECPVDIYIYDSNNKLVSSIEGNEVTLSNENVDIEINDDIKEITLYDDSYYLIYKASANGSMRVTVNEIGSSTSKLRKTIFENIPLSAGETFIQTVDNEYMNNSDYTINSYDNEVFEPDIDVSTLHNHKNNCTEYVGQYSTCTEDGYNFYKCNLCEEWFIEKIETTGHSLGNWCAIMTATCETSGTEQRDCSECDYSETQEIPAIGHEFDGSECKNCDYDKADDCSCNCHKGGIAGFFFKIILFFQKIFKTNKVCKCGKYHY